MISPFKAVFFDAGGTLFHPYPSVGVIYREAASQYGCNAPSEQLDRLFLEAWMKRDGLAELVGRSNEKIEREWWRHLVHEVFSQTGGVRDFEKFFEELYDKFARPEAWRIYPDALDVLKELKRRGKMLGIISNWDSRLFKLCDGLGVLEYFDFILASAVFGASKPSPRIFQEALKRSGVRPSEAVHIGDSFEDDVKGALSVGMEAILVDRHPKGRPDVWRASPKAGRKIPKIKMIRDLKELIA